MANRILSTLPAASVAFVAVASPALADERGAAYGAGTVGALFAETRGLAVNAAEVARQGGAATAGAVRWIATPARPVEGSVYGAGSVGAMYFETRGVATSAEDVARQGGGVTAAAVRWTDGEPRS